MNENIQQLVCLVCGGPLIVSTEKMKAYCQMCDLDHKLNGIDVNELKKIEEL